MEEECLQVQDIIIIGAGIAGLTTALGLHRNGLRSLVLESWDGLRVTGSAFTTWMNAWKALDAIGLGDSLRRQHHRIQGIVSASAITGLPTFEMSFEAKGKQNGLRSLVLESWDGLRVTGAAFTTWTNAWKALDAIGLGDSLRRQHHRIQGVVTASAITGLPTSEMSLEAKGKHGDHEVRCIRRKVLLESLADELPHGTIRFCSKVVLIEEAGSFKLVHLADGSILKTKVLIGCDGVNSIVARWLGLQKPAFTGRLAIRGMAELPNDHSFGTKCLQFFGDGYRSGFLPCDQKTIHWWFTFSPSAQDQEIEDDSTKMKQFVLSKLHQMPKEIMDVVEKSDLESIISAPLRFRMPMNLLWGPIYKGNVCVAGDALHPMTPDIGQGGCAALEDGVVLARCLSQAFLTLKENPNESTTKEENIRIQKALQEFAQERKWRSFQLISTAYLVGKIQQSNKKLIKFIRDKILSRYLAGLLLRSADYNCGSLNIS